MKRILPLTLALSLAWPLSLAETPAQTPQAPQAEASVLAQLRGLTGATYFLALLNMAGLLETLELEGPFTIFAPSDEAFLFMPGDEFEALMADPAALRETLSYHIVEGSYSSGELLAVGSLVTLQGDVVNLAPGDDGPVVNDAVIIMGDIEANNGVIHVINGVLRPDADGIVPPA